MFLALLLACTGPARPDAIPALSAGPAVSLSLDSVAFAELTLPQDSRDGRAPPDLVPVTGPWTSAGSTDEATRWETPLPVRPRALFFFKPPEGMRVLSDGKPIPHGEGKKRGWTFNATTLTVSRPLDAGPPESSTIGVEYPFAKDREARLNLAFSGVDTRDDFVRTTVQTGSTSWSGLLLPAPATAAFDVTLPPAAELTFRPGLVPPEELDAEPSDGATIRVEIVADGVTTQVYSGHFTGPDFPMVRADLSAWSGKAVRVRILTEPGPTSRFDYAFLVDPTIASRKADPQRVVLIFVDTVRADHLGTYGYERDTSAPLDAWAAEGATVFTQARSVAPWTLPSTRSVLTGRQPEFWEQADTLQARLRGQGFATAAFTANVYLSSNFDMDRDWAQHNCARNLSAADQVDSAIGWLNENEGRDSLVLVHFMDAHVPYSEPTGYRTRYAAWSPPMDIPEHFDRNSVVKARPKAGPEQQWIVDRYDNNIAYINDEVKRLLDSLRPQDVVVYFADHGEEFWEHGGYEHGHTLYDELIRVPLIVRVPGVAPSRVDGPVSLLDITPTVLEALGRPVDGLDGRSLVGAMKGDTAGMADRDIAFGHPLYDDERWGVLHAGSKYTTSGGDEEIYDLTVDPGEHHDLAVDASSGADWRPRLGAALGREAGIVWRLTVTRGTADAKVDVEVPTGIAEAWVGADPTDRSAATVTIDGTVAHVVFGGGTREVFIAPNEPPAAEEPLFFIGRPGMEMTAVAPSDAAFVPGGAPMARVKAGNNRTVEIGLAVAPRPAGDAIVGSDAETNASLQAIGYQVGTKEEPPEEPKEAPKPDSP